MSAIGNLLEAGIWEEAGDFTLRGSASHPWFPREGVANVMRRLSCSWSGIAVRRPVQAHGRQTDDSVKGT